MKKCDCKDSVNCCASEAKQKAEEMKDKAVEKMDENVHIKLGHLQNG